MKKYVLNTAVLTIASLMAADASMATDAYLEKLFGEMKTIANAKIEADGDIDIIPTAGGGGIDDEVVRSLLGTGSPVGTPNLVDASTVSNRLLTAPLAADYDAFDFAAGALPANQSISARVDVLGPLIDAAFVAGNNLQTNGVTPVAAALGVGTVGVAAPDLLGAVGEFKAILNAGAGDLGEAARDIHEGIGGAALPTDAITNIDTMRDALAIDGANPGVTFASIELARAAVNTALGAGGGAVANKPFLTRLTGVDDADNTNPRLAGSLSGLLSIVPANDVMAQAEARRAALVAMAVAFYAGNAYGDVAIALPTGVRGPTDLAGAGAQADAHYATIQASPATASIELVIKAFLNQA